jgi:hypothetical protein
MGIVASSTGRRCEMKSAPGGPRRMRRVLRGANREICVPRGRRAKASLPAGRQAPPLRVQNLRDLLNGG